MRSGHHANRSALYHIKHLVSFIVHHTFRIVISHSSLYTLMRPLVLWWHLLSTIMRRGRIGRLISTEHSTNKSSCWTVRTITMAGISEKCLPSPSRSTTSSNWGQVKTATENSKVWVWVPLDWHLLQIHYATLTLAVNRKGRNNAFMKAMCALSSETFNHAYLY